MFRKTTTAIIAAGFALALGACAADPSDAPTTSSNATTTPAETSAPVETTAPAAEVAVVDAWARSVPGEDGMNMGAVYATITSPIDDAILSASIEPASAAKMVEVHEVVMGDNGEMKMQQVERIELTAGTAIELKPGSYHIMLRGMPEVLPAGTELTVTIQLENAGPVSFTAVVREDTTPAMGDSMHGGDMSDDMGGDMSDDMGDDMGGDMGGDMSDDMGDDMGGDMSSDRKS